MYAYPGIWAKTLVGAGGGVVPSISTSPDLLIPLLVVLPLFLMLSPTRRAYVQRWFATCNDKVIVASSRLMKVNM